MAIPVSVEPFVDPEAQPTTGRTLFGRIVAIRFVKPLAAVAVMVVLWIDAARQGALPDPWRDGLVAYGGYLMAAAVGAAIGGLVYWRRAVAPTFTPPGEAELPRLPVFLRFDGRRVVVVGGHDVAAAKIPALLAAGASVVVVAPTVCAAIDRSRVKVIEREFQPSDLDGAWFVTAAATPDVNRRVRDAADSRRVFVNAVDDPANATAYLGGTIARGGVTVAISTSGRAPALAGLLREALDELVPADIGTWAQRARELRHIQRRDGVPMAKRRPQLLEELNRLYDSPSGEPRS